LSLLLGDCVERTSCEHLGLLLGQMAEPSHLGMPGFLAHTAPSVEVALRSLVETLDLHDEGGSASFEPGKTCSSMSYTVELEGVAALEVINDLSGVMICKIMWLLCGPEWTPLSVKLQRREPADRGPYRRMFRAPVYFDSPRCEVMFNNYCLERQPPTADALLFRHLMQEAQMLHDLHQGEVTHALPSVLQRGLLSGHFSAPEIAEVFGMHERTLHRRLRAAGTSFRQELDTARRRLSEQLLTNTSLAVGDIATALGYADASGFIRAFDRWCGTTPASWRKQNFLN
jgi:AraC-like DNA-binding protein